MNKVKEIILSYAAKINPTDEQKALAEKRLEVCVGCDKWVQGSIRDFCSVCGCTTSAKIFSPVRAACPENKWQE